MCLVSGDVSLNGIKIQVFKLTKKFKNLNFNKCIVKGCKEIIRDDQIVLFI